MVVGPVVRLVPFQAVFRFRVHELMRKSDIMKASRFLNSRVSWEAALNCRLSANISNQNTAHFLLCQIPNVLEAKLVSSTLRHDALFLSGAGSATKGAAGVAAHVTADISKVRVLAFAKVKLVIHQ